MFCSRILGCNSRTTASQISIKKNTLILKTLGFVVLENKPPNLNKTEVKKIKWCSHSITCVGYTYFESIIYRKTEERFWSRAFWKFYIKTHRRFRFIELIVLGTCFCFGSSYGSSFYFAFTL